ncbi:PadR family transcriptional regulator [Paenibacillus chitinolyticus]|uniref:PadR family transcriptional regulator n=1 Tax=Paenibacillus chitinolyticus TaxID=79263 RepID=UPI001C46AE83|nr:PadR family transcriptional regulator [Paenibacillus chitinolyticus]MBV6715689.1 PadR family transcriptional regulator [Paenibacillus chitinolyticus]
MIYISTYTQMLKGILEGCILAIISQNEVYGYELSRKLQESGFDYVSEGSIYPVLLRMQKEKWIEGYMKADTRSGGPPRKYYRLTKAGGEVLAQFHDNWSAMKRSVDHILEGGNPDEYKSNEC